MELSVAFLSSRFAYTKNTDLYEKASLPRTARVSLRFLFAASLLSLSACATLPYSHFSSAPGFFMGLFHGFVVIFSFIGSLLVDEISIYAAPNSGGWYDSGYILGLLGFFGTANESA